MMKVSQVLETCLYVDDLDAAEGFYARVFGLARISRVEGRHVFFRCGDAVFLLFNPDTTIRPGNSASGVPTHGAKGPGHVAFRMRQEDVEAWRDHLRQHRVSIEKEVEWPGGGYSIYFRDPAGNSVELATPKTWEIG
jgi:catechol 2,3-dioxygenase-like lactoylglutathione lyase family enzyme